MTHNVDTESVDTQVYATLIRELSDRITELEAENARLKAELESKRFESYEPPL